MVAGKRKRYDYPRWEFVNSSDDIIGICTAALDLLCLRWTRPRVDSISVARAYRRRGRSTSSSGRRPDARGPRNLSSRL